MAVNPNNGIAMVKDGVLKITLYKAQPPKLMLVTTVSEEANSSWVIQIRR